MQGSVFNALLMKPICITLLLSVLTFSAFCQENRIIERNNVGWYTYNGDHTLAPRWALHTEYQWRRIDFIRTWQQSLARLGLVYKLTDRVQVSGGYTLFTTYPYGRYPSADAGVPTTEHRIYEDIQVSDKFGRLELEHRIRLEQRFLGQPSDSNPRQIASWEYQHRVRYQLSATFPLSGTTIDNGEFYLNAFDELFIGFGRQVGANVFNQNRISGGLGYQVNDKFTLELNYFNRILQHGESEPVSNTPIFDIDSGVRFNVNYDLDFSRK